MSFSNRAQLPSGFPRIGAGGRLQVNSDLTVSGPPMPSSPTFQRYHVYPDDITRQRFGQHLVRLHDHSHTTDRVANRESADLLVKIENDRREVSKAEISRDRVVLKDMKAHIKKLTGAMKEGYKKEITKVEKDIQWKKAEIHRRIVRTAQLKAENDKLEGQLKVDESKLMSQIAIAKGKQGERISGKGTYQKIFPEDIKMTEGFIATGKSKLAANNTELEQLAGDIGERPATP